jgi:hypothetical protein
MLSALGGAASALVLSHFWNALAVVSAAMLILGILYTARALKAAET